MLVLFSTSCGNRELSPVQQAALENRLIEGVLEGSMETVDSCLRKGVNANIYDEQGTPVLTLAAITGETEMARRLLKAGAKANARRENYYYSTALMEISANNDIDMAELLLKNGADVNVTDTFGDPAINWASYYGHIDFVKLLLDNGARWDINSKNGTALEVAMKQWNDPLIRFFIQRGMGQKIENTLGRLLVENVKKNNSGGVKNQLEKGADPNQKDEIGTPVVVQAASEGNVEILELLLEFGAEPDQLNRIGQSALSWAAYYGHDRAVKLLLEYKASVDLAGEKYHLTPLISAANGGHASVGRMLIKAGAKIDAQDGLNGFTPLMLATALGHKDFVEILLQARANPYIKSHDGSGVYDMLSLSRNEKILQLLQDYIQKN